MVDEALEDEEELENEEELEEVEATGVNVVEGALVEAAAVGVTST